jgi:hypothetical protein
MREMLQTCFSGPVLPASILLLMITAYWLMVILGALDLDLLHFDLDLDGDVDVDGTPELSGLLGAGMVVFRFLNLGRIPLMVWMSVFALALWITSAVWYHESYSETAWMSFQILLRNSAVALVATKILTQPMLGLVDKTRPTVADDLVGKLCVISTAEATERRGQAKLYTEASPLLLNVRTVDGTLAKGDVAKIVEYDRVRRIYFIEKAEREVEA